MLYDKPSGVMHDVIKRAMEELRGHNNPYGAITLITNALSNSEPIPLSSGRDYVKAPQSSSSQERIFLSQPATPLAGGVGSAFAGYASVRAPSTQSSSNSGGGGGHVGAAAASAQASTSGGTRHSTGGSGGTTGKPHQLGPHPSLASSSLVQGFIVGGGLTQDTLPSPVVASNVGSGGGRNKSAANGSAIAIAAAAEDGSATDSVSTRTRYTFNATQVLRLLLIRAEAYSMTKQHENALQDALSAVEVSRGRSPEAYFTIGREQRKLLRISESVSAFDTGEALLQSIKMGLSQDLLEDYQQDPPTDEEFWAQRGVHQSEAQVLGVTRREMELQEQAISASATEHTAQSRSYGGASSGSVLIRAASRGSLSSASPSASVGNLHGGGESLSALGGGILRGSAGPLSAEDGGCTPSMSPQAAALTEHEVDELLYFRCGLSSTAVAMWRRLANESRALATMRVTHTVPFSVFHTTMSLLDTRISNVRGGIVISVENSAGKPLQLLGCTASDAMYSGGFTFPETIPKGHCGLAMLQPRSWGGFSGFVCYSVHEQLSVFMYFDCPLLGGIKYGVRFCALRSADLLRALAEAGSAGAAGITGVSVSTIASSKVTAASTIITPATGALGGATRGGSAPTPLQLERARAEAQAAVQMPNALTWANCHRVSYPGPNMVKLAVQPIGAQVVCYSVAEMLALRLRSVELLPTLEYCGPVTLKKISAASRRYRELINRLPPPLFYGGGRRSYPDYVLSSDRSSSPWTVPDKEPVTWRISFEGKVLEREEYVVANTDGVEGIAMPPQPILCISTEAQTKMASTVYYSDKRSPQVLIKESWLPFNSNVYFTTPLGRTFAVCSSPTPGIFTLAVGGVNSGKNEEVLYTARKRTGLSSTTTTACVTGITSNGIVIPNATGAGTVEGKVVASSSSLDSLSLVGNTTNLSGSGGIVTGRVAKPTSATSPSTASHVDPNQALVTGSAVSASLVQARAVGVVRTSTNSSGVIPNGTVARGTVASTTSPSASSLGLGNNNNINNNTGATTMSSGSYHGNSSNINHNHHHNAGGSAVHSLSASHLATTGGVSVAAAISGAAGNAPQRRVEHFTIWRPQHISGGALLSSPNPSRTNEGAVIVAELKITSPGMHSVGKGFQVAEMRLLNGADALLVTLLAFCISRW